VATRRQFRAGAAGPASAALVHRSVPGPPPPGPLPRTPCTPSRPLSPAGRTPAAA